MTRAETAFIRSMRGERTQSGAPAADIGLTDAEKATLAQWYATAASMRAELWIQDSGASASDLAIALAQHTGHSMMFPSSILPTRSADPLYQSRCVMAYYEMHGYNVRTPPVFVPTPEQAETLDITKNYVINAGPGTGKTTSAVARIGKIVAARDSCLVLSFQNSAISTFADAVNKIPALGQHVYMSGLGALKEHLITMSTIDGIVSSIIGQGRGGMLRAAGMQKDFDADARSALSMLNNPGTLSGVMQRFPQRFSHIIVDEAQTASDTRMQIVLRLWEIMNITTLNVTGRCSLAIYGDPKQALGSDNSGRLYAQLLAGSDPRIQSVAFTVSHRFKNPYMLDMVNKLSISVGDTVQLRSAAIDPGAAGPPVEIYPLASMFELTQRLASEHKTDRIGVAALSIDRTNRCSETTRAFFNCMLRAGVRFAVKSDRNFRGNGARVSTWHGAIGTEYDILVLIGMSAFPQGYPNIAESSARALIFVMHTRARKKIYYVAGSNLVPRYVDPRYTAMAPGVPGGPEAYVVPTQYIAQIPTHFSSYQLFRDNTGSRFMQANGIIAAFDRSVQLGPQTLDQYALYCAVCRKNRGRPGLPQRTNTRPCANIHRELKNGTVLPGGKYYGSSDTYAVPPTDMSECELFYWLQDQRAPNLASAITAATNESCVSIIEEFLHTEGQSVQLLMPLVPKTISMSAYELVNSVDLTIVPTYSCGDYVITVTDDPMVAYVHARALDKKPAMITHDARLVVLKHDPTDQFRILYLLVCLREIHIHHITVDMRRNLLGSIKSPYDDKLTEGLTYFVDTEYLNVKTGLQTFEVALVNRNDPFRSLCAAMRIPQSEEASQHLGMTPEYFNKCAVSCDIMRRLAIDNDPLFAFYSAAADIKWLTPESKYAPKLNLKTLDVHERGRQIAEQFGFFSSSSPTIALQDLYGALVSPVELEEGRHHRALTDALYLRTLCVLGKLQ